MEPITAIRFQTGMANDTTTAPAKKKFRALAGAGGACIAVGILLSFTIIGLPLGIPVIIAGIILLAVSPAFKAKHLVRSRERRKRDND